MKKPKDQKQQPPAQAQAASRDRGLEPIARHTAVPALVFAGLVAFLFWGDMHLTSQGGELDARVHYPFESVKQIDSLHIKAAVDPRLSKGEGIYNLVCKACHQEDGMGGVAQGCPPLVGSEWVLSKDPSRIAGIVLKGLTGPITVSGKSYGTGTMTPFGDSLSDDDIASVLSYVRNNWSNRAPLVDIADLKKMRAQFKDRPGYLDVSTLMTVPLKD